MYEAEVNSIVESAESLPIDIRERFAELRDRIVARTVLPWGEHCTECVWPSCYSSCDLYSPRPDGNCRQFVEGMVRLDHKEGVSPYILKLRFKKWAKLWTVGNLRLRSSSAARKTELVNIAVGAVGRNVPLPQPIRQKVLHKIAYLRREAAVQATASGESPDHFLLECYNPNARQIDLTFTVRGDAAGSLPYQAMINVPHGYTRATIPFAEIAGRVDMGRSFNVEVVPNECDDTVLYFGLMDFVKLHSVSASRNGPAQPRTGKIKCIVWDLDNTLWEGVLLEDGPDGIRVREDVVELIKRTDEKGILHSIASKNNFDDAMRALDQLDIADYFLHPQIGWHPKSRSIGDIASLLNIGVDSLAFVDDQEFEREEVRASLPQVTIVDALECRNIEQRPEFNVPVTAESKKRRAMYREQEKRQGALRGYTGDYLGFLRDCDMQIGFNTLDDSNLQRVYELAQRTNQLNFSGNRYQESELRELKDVGHIETYVIDCKDRFGGYGIVGFAVVDVKAPCLLDLMFSCRVQGKRVEHAVLGFLLERFVSFEDRDFHARYRKTAKNTAAGRVFEELGFEKIGEEGDGCSLLVFRRGHNVPNDGIATIHSELPRHVSIR